LVKQASLVPVQVAGQTHSVAVADLVTFSRPSSVVAAVVNKQVHRAGKTLKSPHVLISWQSCSVRK
jgi:hypothetical protein